MAYQAVAGTVYGIALSYSQALKALTRLMQGDFGVKMALKWR